MSTFGKSISSLVDRVAGMDDREPRDLSLNDRGQAVPLTPFDEAVVASRTIVIDLKSTFGLSRRRDVTTETGTGTITNDGGEYILSTGATAGSVARLESADLGRYISGYVAEAGVGIRLPSDPTGDQVVRWGYFDSDDGFFFGRDATGLLLGVRRNGVEQTVRQADWNGDRLDGTGPSGLSLDPADGHVYQLPFVWYGYGNITFAVVTKGEGGVLRLRPVHRFVRAGGNTVANPNLPISVEVENGTTSADLSVRVGGRQFSILGEYRPSFRTHGHYRGTSLTGVDTDWVPVLSYRRKATDNWPTVPVLLEGVSLVTDFSAYWQLRYGADLTGASYGTPAETSADETAVEVDTAATAVSGGDILHPGGVVAAAGSGTNAIGEFVSDELSPLKAPRNEPVTLCIRQMSGTGGEVMAAHVRWFEEW